jgi:hypothetical protein
MPWVDMSIEKTRVSMILDTTGGGSGIGSSSRESEESAVRGDGGIYRHQEACRFRSQGQGSKV